VLTNALPALAIVAGTRVSAAVSGVVVGQDTSGMSRARFDQYVAFYNAGNPDFARFYADDIVMESSPSIIGKEAIVEFVQGLRSYLTETIRVENYAAGTDTVTVQVLTEMRFRRPTPVTALGGLFGRSVRPGQVLRQRGLVIYGLNRGRFSYIRSGRTIGIHAWT